MTAPLARVGDVIEHGQPIPANVVAVSDPDSDLWKRTERGWYCPRVGEWREPDAFAGYAQSLSTLYKALTVVEVDPEPQPAEPDDEDAYAALVADLLTITGVDRAVHLRAAVRNLANGHRAAEAAESGPVVLSLPQVPDGAVALRGGIRWIPAPDGNDGAWVMEGGSVPYYLGRLLDAEKGSVTVEFAPPREPRVWPKLDDEPDILPELVQVDEHGQWTLKNGRQYVSVGRLHEDACTLAQLRTLGEVREVLEP